MDLALNNLQRLICHRTKQTKPNQTNAVGLCCFRYERVYEFLVSVHGDTRRETQFLKPYANHTMLTLPQRVAHLVMFKISIHLCRSRSACLIVRKPNSLLQRSNTPLMSFQNPQFSGPSLLGMTSSTLRPHFLPGVYYDKW